MRTMGKTPSHVLRHSLGTYEGNLLTQWLNQPRRTQDHRRIERLLDNLAMLFSVRAEGPPEGIAAMLQELGVQNRQIQVFKQCAKEVERELARYRMRPVLRTLDTTGKSKLAATLEFNWDCGESPAARAVLLIMSPGNLGLVQRMRRCHKCNRWFYGKFSHQDFCSPKCQQTHYKSSPEWREHRKQYMRKYRRLKESGAVK